MKKHFALRVALCVFAVFIIFGLSGCRTAPDSQGAAPGAQTGPPYLWGVYEEQVYAFLNMGDIAGQIIALEQDLERIVSGGKYPPPGLHAQLGLLYAEIGNREMAIAFLKQEKAFFPEAAVFMNFLIARLEG